MAHSSVLLAPLSLAIWALLVGFNAVSSQELGANFNANIQLNQSLHQHTNAAADWCEPGGLDKFKRSNLYVEPFDPNVHCLPKAHLGFVRSMTASDLELYREILREAIDKRNKFAPSVSLMFKYTGKLLGNFIKNRRTEQRIQPRVEAKSEFFKMLATTTERVMDRSAQVKKEKGYKKNTVNVDELYRRTDALFNYFQRVVDQAPMAAYVRWDRLQLYKDEPNHATHNGDLVEECADLLAQFRAMGYDSTIFVGRRITNLLRMFSRGVIPSSDKEV